MKKFLMVLAVVLTVGVSIPAQAGFFGTGFGGFFGSGAVEATFLNTLTTAEYIWEADHGTTIDTGVTLWADRVVGKTQDKLNTAEQPTLTTSVNFGGQSVLDFNKAATQGMDTGTNTVDLTINDQITLSILIEHDSAATTAVLAEVSNGASANSVCNITTTSGGTILARCKNDVNGWVTATWTRATNFSVKLLTLVYDGTSGGNIKFYDCNTQVATGTTVAGGFFTTSNDIFTMQAANDTFHSDGKVALYILDNNAWSTDTLAQAVAIANAKYGVCN